MQDAATTQPTLAETPAALPQLPPAAPAPAPEPPAKEPEVLDPDQATAIGYIRVSTDSQETARQESDIIRYCKANNIILLDILREPAGISGRADALKKGPKEALDYYMRLCCGALEIIERPGYAELLRRVQAEHPTLAIFYALDRLSRDRIELLLLERLLASYGATILNVSQGGSFDTSTSMGNFMYGMAALTAQLEVDQTRERTRATLANKKLAGVYVGRPPIGWMKDEAINEFIHDPESWPMVERINQLRQEKKKYREINQITGVAMGSISSYLDAFAWKPQTLG